MQDFCVLIDTCPHHKLTKAISRVSSIEISSHPCLAEHVEPLLERYGVQLYLAGHDHDLELQRGPGSGVTHVLTGAGSETRGFRGTTDSLFQHAASGETRDGNACR